jgi:hypothetical protein
MTKKLFTIAILITMIIPICLEAGPADRADRRARRAARQEARIANGETTSFWTGAFGRSPNLVDCRTTVQGDADLFGVALITGAMKSGYDADQIDALVNATKEQ